MHSRTLFAAVFFLLPLPARPAPAPKNLQILPKTMTSAELQATMEGFTRQLGVKCVFCHVPDQYEKDDRPHKAEARRMIRLVLDLKVKKAEFFSKGTEDATLNCGLCHQGAAEPEPFAASLFGGFAFLPGFNPGGDLRNLQVLPKGTTAAEVKRTMNSFTGQLGVKCEFCHADNPAADSKPAKATARRMMRLVAALKAKRISYFGPRAQESLISCGLCHRGATATRRF